MSVRKPSLPAGMLAAVSAAALAACGSVEPHGTSFNEPFGFAEVRQIAAPIGSFREPVEPSALPALQQYGGRISVLYGDALARFEGIYGDGVGPARKSADFLGCKETFRQVAAQIGNMPDARSATGIEATWAALEHCHKVAQAWSGPAEMATFGNDLKAMTEGSMLVVSYAAAAAGLPSGRQHYRETAALIHPADARELP